MTPKKLLKYVVFAVVACNLVIIAVVLLGSKSEPPEPMPNPNGYDDFVRAGMMLTGKAYEFYQTNDQRALADFVSKNEEALKSVRLGLSRNCRVPNNYSADYLKKLLPDLSNFRGLAYLFCAEGRLAEMQSRTNDAVESYLNGIKFGELSSKGGVMFAKFVGIASENEPRRRLRSLIQYLSIQQCRDIAQKLEVLNDEEEAVEKNLKEEKSLVNYLGWREHLEEVLGFLGNKMVRENKNRAIQKIQANRLERIQLMVKFAERAYELEKGKKPRSPAELVPEYLKSVPIDPTTGTNIAYLP